MPSSESSAAQARLWRRGPHLAAGSTHGRIVKSWIIASALAAFCGTALYGPAALRVLAIAATAAVITESLYRLTSGNRYTGGPAHACLMGILLGLTLPATIPWHVPMVGSIVAICVKCVLGGASQCLWHPALIGRVVLQFVYLPFLSLAPGAPTVYGPVLARHCMFVGNLDRAVPIQPADYHGWRIANESAANTDAFVVERPVTQIRAFTDGAYELDPDSAISTLVRDILPPWEDTVLGTVPGGIGETSAVGLIVGCLFLVYRGHLRWQLPIAVLASAAVAAAVFPIQAHGPEAGYRWVPALAYEGERVVGLGLSYVLFHLTTGQLLIGACLLAGDMNCTPMRARGQIVFGVGVGVLTIFLRLYGPLDGACYWSILAMNTLSRTIDRRMKRPLPPSAS